MRKCLVLLVVLLVSLTCLTVSANESKILIGGNSLKLNDSTFIINNRTYVPMRDLFENIGAKVLWDNETNSATAILNNTTVSFKIDSNVITKNGENHLSDGECKLINGKTYIPLRIILELLGFNVNWNEGNQNIEILPPESGIPDTEKDEHNTVQVNNEYEIKVLELINIERNKQNLDNLVIDNNLSSVARAHSKDMYERSFFSHINPDGKSPFDRIKSFGISYQYAAENIAAGQSTPEDVVNSWMNSEGHRKNILNPNFKKIGIGYYNSGKNYIHYWTQCFTD